MTADANEIVRLFALRGLTVSAEFAGELTGQVGALLAQAATVEDALREMKGER